MAEYFLDTNILLYAITTTPGEAEKARIAQNLILSTEWAWSAQVAAEFVRASTASRRSKPLTRAEAGSWIQIWMTYPLAPIDGQLVLEALNIAERYQTPYFDAQILAVARRIGCTIVYSEDFNHGQLYEGVRVINPFR